MCASANRPPAQTNINPSQWRKSKPPQPERGGSGRRPTGGNTVTGRYPASVYMLPYLYSDYLLNRHPNKLVTGNSCPCALNIGKQIPEPFCFRECLPLPTIRASPGAPVTVTNQNPTISRRSNTARRNTPPKDTPSHKVLDNTREPASVIAQTC